MPNSAGIPEGAPSYYSGGGGFDANFDSADFSWDAVTEQALPEPGASASDAPISRESVDYNNTDRLVTDEDNGEDDDEDDEEDED
jgi:hypothetical protein